MSVELKPCPLCGGQPTVPHKIGGGDERCGYNFTMSIACKCGLRLSAESKRGQGGWCEDSGEAEKNVVKAWNKRPSTEAKHGVSKNAARYRWLMDNHSKRVWHHCLGAPKDYFDCDAYIDSCLYVQEGGSK